jgi:phosphatidate phosphatase LPIN
VEEVIFGLGGLLTPDRKDPYQFILDLDSVRITFELSLCGQMSGTDEVEDVNRFESSRVSYRRFMAKANVVKSQDLVIRWGDKYVEEV